MRFALFHPGLLTSGASTALFWLIGGVLVLVSLQLRRFSAARPAAQPNEAVARRMLIRERAMAARQLAARE